MSRQAMQGIGQVIKANTTEKSIDELRAEGKHRVRVVSSERVMAIIQAIVDDTINSEVGEITKRDRDRIVSDTQDRFSRVLRMQQDLEQKVDDLRESLRGAERERDRLSADKALLESQLDAARRGDGDADAVAKLARDLSRVREAVERAPREGVVLDDAAVARVAEKLAARDAQNARRITAEFDDLRTRLDSAGRDAAAEREATTGRLLQRVKEQNAQAESQIAARLEREFRSVAVCLAEIREEVGRASGAGDAVTRLRAELDAVESRIHGLETSSNALAEQVATAVLRRVEERETAADGRRGIDSTLDAAQVTESLARLHHASDEARQGVLRELAEIRRSVDDARAHALGVQAERFRELEQRTTDRAPEAGDVLALGIERLAEHSAAVDDSLRVLRRDVVDVVERAAASIAAPSAEALVQARSEAAKATTAAARAAELQSAHASRFDAAVAELHAEFTASAARAVDAAERQQAAIAAMGERIARSATAQSDSLATNFKGALDRALDQITRTMERATARPIESHGEATEVLVARMFDAPDGELTSNLDQLEVEERRSIGGIAESVGRLKQMSAPATNGKS